MHTLETSEDAEEPIFARFALFAFSKLSVTEHLLCKGTMDSTFENLCLFEKCLGNVIFSLRIYIHIHTYIQIYTHYGQHVLRICALELLRNVIFSLYIHTYMSMYNIIVYIRTVQRTFENLCLGAFAKGPASAHRRCCFAACARGCCVRVRACVRACVRVREYKCTYTFIHMYMTLYTQS